MGFATSAYISPAALASDDIAFQSPYGRSLLNERGTLPSSFGSTLNPRRRRRVTVVLVSTPPSRARIDVRCYLRATAASRAMASPASLIRPGMGRRGQRRSWQPMCPGSFPTCEAEAMQTRICFALPRLERSLVVIAIITIAAMVGCTDRSAPPTPTAPHIVARAVVPAPYGDLVPTPVGWYEADCVHAIPNHAHVHVNGLVTLPSGSSYRTPACSRPGKQAAPTGAPEGPTLNGWVDSAGYGSESGPYWGSMTTSAHVPQAPATTYSTNQVLYMFPGVERSSGIADSNFILQPVLTYGYVYENGNYDYGGNYWSMASWRCNTGTDCSHGPVLEVAPGDSIESSLTASACANRMCTWTIVYVDVTQDVRKDWSLDDSAAYWHAYGGTLEVYNLSSCSAFPDSGINFTGISLYDQNQQQASPSWMNGVTPSPSPSCGFNVTSTATDVMLADDPGPAVYISGPQSAAQNSQVTETANASNGVTPYSYAWTVNGNPNQCGNATTCSAVLGDSGSVTTFVVTVTDANELTASYQREVLACGSGFEPLDKRAAGSAGPYSLCGP